MLLRFLIKLTHEKIIVKLKNGTGADGNKHHSKAMKLTAENLVDSGLDNVSRNICSFYMHRPMLCLYIHM